MFHSVSLACFLQEGFATARLLLCSERTAGCCRPFPPQEQDPQATRRILLHEREDNCTAAYIRRTGWGGRLKSFQSDRSVLEAQEDNAEQQSLGDIDVVGSSVHCSEHGDYCALNYDFCGGTQNIHRVRKRLSSDPAVLNPRWTRGFLNHWTLLSLTAVAIPTRRAFTLAQSASETCVTQDTVEAWATDMSSGVVAEAITNIKAALEADLLRLRGQYTLRRPEDYCDLAGTPGVERVAQDAVSPFMFVFYRDPSAAADGPGTQPLMVTVVTELQVREGLTRRELGSEPEPLTAEAAAELNVSCAPSVIRWEAPDGNTLVFDGQDSICAMFPRISNRASGVSEHLNPLIHYITYRLLNDDMTFNPGRFPQYNRFTPNVINKIKVDLAQRTGPAKKIYIYGPCQLGKSLSIQILHWIFTFVGGLDTVLLTRTRTLNATEFVHKYNKKDLSSHYDLHGRIHNYLCDIDDQLTPFGDLKAMVKELSLEAVLTNGRTYVDKGVLRGFLPKTAHVLLGSALAWRKIAQALLTDGCVWNTCGSAQRACVSPASFHWNFGLSRC